MDWPPSQQRARAHKVPSKAEQYLRAGCGPAAYLLGLAWHVGHDVAAQSQQPLHHRTDVALRQHPSRGSTGASYLVSVLTPPGRDSEGARRGCQSRWPWTPRRAAAASAAGEARPPAARRRRTGGIGGSCRRTRRPGWRLPGKHNAGRVLGISCPFNQTQGMKEPQASLHSAMILSLHSSFGWALLCTSRFCGCRCRLPFPPLNSYAAHSWNDLHACPLTRRACT